MHYLLLTCLLALALFASVNGLLKLPASAPPLVPNPRADVVYLFIFPRTTNSPSQAALNLKVETWLKWKIIPFHRLSNQFFLGSASVGAAPFAYYGGQPFDGSDAIVEGIGAELGDYEKMTQKESEEKEMRTMIDDILFKVLMFDRAQSLSWMVKDEGIAAQMGPILGINQQRTEKLDKFGTFTFTLNFASLSAMFEAYNKPTEQKAFVGKYLKGEQSGKVENVRELFGEFEQWVRTNVVNPALETVLMTTVNGQPNQRNAQGNSMAKVRELLKLNRLDLDKYANALGEEVMDSQIVRKVKGKQFAEVTEKQLGELIKVIMEKAIGKRLEKHGGKQLFDTAQTPADASLFGILVQYYETPLNYADTIGALFRDESGKPKTGTIWHKFVQNVKQSLGLDGGHSHSSSGGTTWKALTQYPWTLNYDGGYNAQRATYFPFQLSPTQFALPSIVSDPKGIVSLAGDESDLSKEYPDGQLEAIRALIQIVNQIPPPSTKQPHARSSEDRDRQQQNTMPDAKLQVTQALLEVAGTYICTLTKCADWKHTEREAEKALKENANIGQLTMITSALGGDIHNIGLEKIARGVRQRVYAELVAHADRAVAQRVLAAVSQANAAIAAETDPQRAAALTSFTEIGNEF